MEQTLELKMKSQAEDAIKKINELSKTVSSLGDSVKKVTSTLTSSAKTTNTTITSTRKEGDKLYTTIRKIGSDGSLKKTTVSVKELEGATTGARSNFSKLADTISKLGKGLSLAGLYIGIKNMASKFMDWMDLAVDRIEQLNLFNVVFKNITKDGQEAFSTLGKEAINFQYKLKEAFGTNLTDTLQHQALFQSMAENQGIGDTYAKLMSENMTKMVYDLGSLYNRSEEDVAAALKAGVYAGQTKPLRAFGLDITSTSLQPLLDSLGINDRSIAELSQAEKQILRYIAVLKQAQVAMGDYANNIESPAIQTKVFKNTLIEAKVALQSLFIQTFAKILPYANAILMVITEVTKAIASFFGIKLQDYNSGIASNLGDIDDGIDSVGDSAGSATGKVKELKRQLLGFDQINNINDPKDSGSSGGSGGGASGGIDQRLLDALYGYDNGMDKIRMKATEIRDKIMEWLGFMKVIDPITGEVSFKFANTQSTIYKLVMAFKDIIKYGKKVIKDVFRIIKDDFDNGAFGSALVGIFRAIANLLKFISEHKGAEQVIAKLAEAFLTFKLATTIISPFVNKFKKLSDTLKVFTGGKKAKDKIKDISGIAKEAKNSFKVPNAKTILKGIEDLALIIAGMTAIVLAIGLLTKIPGFNETMNGGITSVVNLFKGLGSIIIPLAAFSAGISILGGIGISKVAKGLADLAIVIVGTEAVVSAVGLISKLGLVDRGIETTKKVFNGIAEIGLTLGILSTAMMVAGLLGGFGVASMARGLADLAIVIDGAVAVVAVAGAINKIAGEFIASGAETVKKVFDLISEIGVTLGILSASLMAAGLLGGIGAAALAVGLADFAIVVGGVSLVLVALGAIKQIPGFDWIVGQGISLLNKLAIGLGEFAGNIVKGFTGVAFDNLGSVGSKLSEFAINAAPFFKEVKNIDDTTSTAVRNMATAILELTASNVLDSLTSWFTGGVSLEEFGNQLVAFGPKFKKYADTVKGINPDVVTASSSAALSIAEFANKLPNQGGVASWFAGDNTLDKFSSYLPTFGKNMKKYAQSIAGIDTGVVKATSEAAKSIVEFSKNVPNEGGVASWFAGENRIDKFSEYLPTFGKNMNKYSQSIAGIDTNIVSNTTKAAKAIVEMAKIIPNSGGVASWFAGDNKLSDFGVDIAKFGAKFKEYYNTIKNIGTAKINEITTAVKSAIDQFKRVKDGNLNETIKSFGDALKSAGSGIVSYFTSTLSNSKGWNVGYSFGQSVASGLRSGIKDNFSLSLKLTQGGSTVKTYKVQAYANGGFPEDGWFRASHGEIMGSFDNGKSVVANNQQITAGIEEAAFRGYMRAIQESGGAAASQIELYAHTDEGVIIDRINQKTATTGVCPINIPF